MAITKVIAKITGCCFCWIVEATQPTPGSFGTVAGVGAVAQGVASAGQLSGSANVAGVPGAQPQTPVVVVASAYQPRASAGRSLWFWRHIGGGWDGCPHRRRWWLWGPLDGRSLGAGSSNANRWYQSGAASNPGAVSANGGRVHLGRWRYPSYWLTDFVTKRAVFGGGWWSRVRAHNARKKTENASILTARPFGWG